MARPRALTPELQEKIIQAIQVGNFFHVACEYAGISRAAGWKWLARGKDAIARAEEHETPVPEGERIYVEFVEAVMEARAQAEVRLVTSVVRAGTGENADWRAAIEILRRGFKENWRDEAAIQLGGEIKVEGELDDGLARLEAVAQIIAESSGASPNGSP